MVSHPPPRRKESDLNTLNPKRIKRFLIVPHLELERQILKDRVPIQGDGIRDRILDVGPHLEQFENVQETPNLVESEVSPIHNGKKRHSELGAESVVSLNGVIHNLSQFLFEKSKHSNTSF
jgi:hypothetical protein